MTTNDRQPSTDPNSADDFGSLSRKIMGGLGWLFTGQFAIQLCRFATNLILTRLLLPEAFGVMGLVQVFMVSLDLFSDVGLRQSVIYHRRGESPTFLNTVWTVQVVRGFIIWAICCLGAYPFAALYGMPELRWLLPIVGASSAVRGFCSTRLMVAGRRLDLRFPMSVELWSLVIGNVVTIVLALILHSVLALAIGWIVTQASLVWLSYRASDTPRNRFHWEQETVQSIGGFGRWSVLSSALTVVQSRGDRLVMGKLLPEAALGAYMIGANLALMPMMLFARLNGTILQPAYARLRHMPSQEARSKMRRLRLGVVLGHVPVLAVLAIFGQPIVDLLYPERLSMAGWYCSLIAVAAMIRVATDAGPIFPARGDARTHFQIIVMRSVATVLAMVAGYYVGRHYGNVANGVIYGVVLAPLLAYPYQAIKYQRIHAWLPEVDVLGIMPALIIIATQLAALS